MVKRFTSALKKIVMYSLGSLFESVYFHNHLIAKSSQQHYY